MVTSDDWTKSAMRDGEVVAELLVKLKKAKVRPVLFSCPTLRWGTGSHGREKKLNQRDVARVHRSWSASSSPSAYLDGHEATIGSSPVGSRSKVRPYLPLSNSIVYVCLNTIKIFIFTTNNISRFIASLLLCSPTKLEVFDMERVFLSFRSCNRRLDFDVKRLQNKKDIALLSERGDIKNKNLKRMKLNTQIFYVSLRM
ncbi:hypothetical protein HID58_094465 [Brassica napus]|uniref:Uncharacterized protein n=1 Tax=Brassica napus TaxID=3708 RepID=A0ABQ7X753_BRANA|nr:hypothetical protein HID58_094465 [Brassica napus]